MAYTVNEWGVRRQADALEQYPVHEFGAAVAGARQMTDAPTLKPATAGESVVPGVDAGWIRRIQRLLVETGKISPDMLSEENLADEQHRRWLQKQLRKARAEQQAAAQPPTAKPATPPGTGGIEPAPVQTGGIEPAPGGKPVPSVLSPGHLPTKSVWRSTAVPAGGGWTPAGDGLWWPPYPVTGGPIARPATMDATKQADALTGQG